MTLSVCLPDIEANRLNCIPSRGRSDSRVVIHEKWGRSTPELHQPGRGNLERGNSEESHIKVRARRLRYILSGLQVLFSCLVVILLSQSLLLFQATKDNLMTSTSSIWPNNVKLSWDIIAIVLNLIISLIAIFLLLGYFWKYNPVQNVAHMALSIVSTLCILIFSLISAALLKGPEAHSPTLYEIACTLAPQTDNYDHTTICQSHNTAFAFTILQIPVSIFLLLSLWYTYSRTEIRSSPFRRSRQSLQARFRDFQIEVRSIRVPSPIYRRPRAYPGRVWRLAWGEMDEHEHSSPWKRRSSSIGPLSPVGPRGET